MSKKKPKPLTKRTMTLSQLQLRTLDVIRRARFQLSRPAHENNLNDSEFIEKVLEPLETDIYQGRQILKMARKQ
jgi:hypothetical protein